MTSIPLDANEDEIADVFKRYGVLAENIETRKPRIKMYPDEKTGKFKGEALVVYFRPESVGLAIQMLDDVDFRPGQQGPEGKMTVMPADLSFKKHKDENPAAAGADTAGTDNNTEGNNDAESEKRKKAPKKIDRRQAAQLRQELNNKLADWSDDEPQALTETSERFDKVVVLRHMFTLEELATDPDAAQDIEDDIRGECEKLGPVRKVFVFDGEPDGVVTVRFDNSTAANACVRSMDGRHFGGQQVKATISDGTRFRRAPGSKRAGSNDDDRFEAFSKGLGQGGDSDD